MEPTTPAEAQRIVADYLRMLEAHASADLYPGLLRDLPHPKPAIKSAFEVSTKVLAASGQMTTDLADYLEIAYVSLADYVEDEHAALLREYARAGQELAADRRMAREKVSTGAWRRIAEQSRLAGAIARAVSAEADELRAEFRSWRGGGSADPASAEVEASRANPTETGLSS